MITNGIMPMYKETTGMLLYLEVNVTIVCGWADKSGSM
jgi:hypothetical protein